MEFINDQAASRLDLDGGGVLTKCDQCRNAWQDRNKRGIEGEPPCDTCRVELMPENEDSVNVYLVCRNQCLTAGMDGTVIDISLPAVFGVMDRYPGGIKDQWDCMMKVRHLFYHFRPMSGKSEEE